MTSGLRLRGLVTFRALDAQDQPMRRHSPAKARMPKKAALAAAFREIGQNEPRVVAATRRKKGAAAAERQRVAIAFAKARRGG